MDSSWGRRNEIPGNGKEGDDATSEFENCNGAEMTAFIKSIGLEERLGAEASEGNQAASLMVDNVMISVRQAGEKIMFEAPVPPDDVGKIPANLMPKSFVVQPDFPLIMLAMRVKDMANQVNRLYKLLNIKNPTPSEIEDEVRMMLGMDKKIA